MAMKQEIIKRGDASIKLKPQLTDRVTVSCFGYRSEQDVNLERPWVSTQKDQHCNSLTSLNQLRW